MILKDSSTKIIKKLEEIIGEKIFKSNEVNFEEFDNGICKYILNEKNEIVKLRLFHVRLDRFLDEIFLMQNLNELDLGSTQIREIPEDITKLNNLKTLDLSSTQIKEIPESITRLEKLQNLYLSSTQIKEIPESITRLENLQTLDLSSMQIKEIPESITRLEKLQNLDLRSTQIKEIPESITRLEKLQTLYLSSMQIKEIPESITRLEKLQNLDLRSTQIKEIPESITRLEKLQNLYLSSTQIKEIPESITRLEKLQNLYLSSTQIKEIPESITRLEKLQNLYLSSTQIKEIPESITRLEKLQNLDLSSTQIKEIPESITRLEKLQNLDLSSTQIKEIPESITRLEKLQNLDLSSTQIKEIPESITRLEKLQNLDLRSTQIKEIPESITRLEKLQNLDLRSTQIKEIPESITRLEKLQNLDLRSTQIKEIPESITRLEKLQNLYLSSTQIKEIPESITRLEKLQTLDLSSTQIKEIPKSIIELKKLRILDISNTNVEYFENNLIKMKIPISKVDRIAYVNDNVYTYFNKYFRKYFLKGVSWIDWDKVDIKGVYVDKIEFYNLPNEVIEQGRNFIINYLNLSKSKILNEFKILLIGKGGAGKTSLSKRLKKEEFNELEDTTHGILITDYKFIHNSKKYNTKVWDFGGQEMMHSTHKFFLSERCFYILVLDGREDDNVEYWLKHIKSFGGKSPIIIVLNKMDKNPAASLNENYLKKKYPYIKEIFKISCKDDPNVDNVEEGIKKYLNDIENLQINWPENWIKLKNKLEEKGYNYISYDEYKKYCSEYEIEDEKIQNDLLGYLRDLGVVCEFSNWKLQERKVLNPKWITVGVYKIITSDKIKDKNGYVRVCELKKIINDNFNTEEFKKAYEGECYSYEFEDLNYIINLMENFELCYFVDSETILIPSLLNDSEPNYEFDKNSTLEYRFVYDFLSKSVIHRLIVRMKDMVDKHHVWNTGFILNDESNDVKALIKLDEEDRTIYINVKGDFTRNLLANIIKEINSINDSLKDISENVKEFVMKDKIPISLKSIMVHYKKGKYTILADNGNEYVVNELLGDILPRDYMDKNYIDVRGDLHMDEIKGNKLNNVSGDYVGGDKVNISGNDGQVNYAKDKAKIDATMNFDNRSVSLDGVDKEKLYEQLEILKKKFAENEMYKEAGEVKEVIESKEDSKVIGFLKSTGKKILEIGQTTGIPLLVEYVKKELGISE